MESQGIKKDLSIIIPLYNEEESVTALYKSILTVIDPLTEQSEILFVDDGSKDNTFQIAKELASHDKRLRVIKLRKNCGQTPAMVRGLEVRDYENLQGNDGPSGHQDTAFLLHEADKAFRCRRYPVSGCGGIPADGIGNRTVWGRGQNEFHGGLRRVAVRHPVVLFGIDRASGRTRVEDGEFSRPVSSESEERIEGSMDISLSDRTATTERKGIAEKISVIVPITER